MSNDSAKLLEAASFAAWHHQRQRRKDAQATPYINHPIEVATTLAVEGHVGDVDVLITALLHDTVEDTDASLQEIESRFGTAVRDMVAEVTDDKSLPKSRRKELQIETAAKKSDGAKQVKIADKTCNVGQLDRDQPDGWPRDRKLAYLRWAREVVEGCRGVNPRLDCLFDQAAATAQHRLSKTDPRDESPHVETE